MRHASYSSRSIHLGTRLLAAASVIAAPITLSGCGEEPTPASATYTDAQSCIDDGMFTPEFCRQAFHDAQSLHDEKAPHYDTREACEQDWSDQSCEIAQDNGSAQSYGTYGGSHGGYIYQPHMTGVWIGGSGQSQRYAYPLYRTQDGSLYAPSTRQSFTSFGRMTTTPAATESGGSSSARFAPSRPGGSSFDAIVRGGFGSVGHGFGGGGE